MTKANNKVGEWLKQTIKATSETKLLYLSIDYGDVVPIATKRLMDIAYSPMTSPEYAQYLQDVINKAKECCDRIGCSFESVKFQIHETGCIVPFGECHPYTRRFDTRIHLPLITSK